MKKIFIFIGMLILLSSFGLAITLSQAYPYLTHYYSLDGTYGHNDRGLSPFNLTNYGATNATDIWGNPNSAYDFEHSELDFLNATEDILLQGVDGTSVIASLWAKTETVQGGSTCYTAIGCGANSGEGILFTNHDYGLAERLLFGRDNEATPGQYQLRDSLLGNDEIVLITIAYNGSDMFLCLNTTCSNTLDLGTQGFAMSNCHDYGVMIGGEPNRNYMWDGILDNVIIYNYTVHNISELEEWASMMYNGGDEFIPILESFDSVVVANNSYSNHSINLTSDGGQSCGYNESGEYTLCGPTQDETPTIRFKMAEDRGTGCKLWNESLNWTTLDNAGKGANCTLNDDEYTCTFPEKLLDGNHTLYVSCKSYNYQMNDFSSYPSNSFTILIQKDANSSNAIENGIKASLIWPGAIIYTNQPVYVRTKYNQEAFAVFDKVAVYGSQRWAFNYVSLNETDIGTFYNLSPVFYFFEMENLTTTSIENEVSNFISTTKT